MAIYGSNITMVSPNLSARADSGSITRFFIKTNRMPKITMRGLVIQFTYSVRATPHILRRLRTAVTPLSRREKIRGEENKRKTAEQNYCAQNLFGVYPQNPVGVDEVREP